MRNDPIISRRTVLAGMASTAILPIARPAFAQTADVEALAAAAKAKGGVTYYSAQSASVNDRLKAAFEAEYGIALSIFSAPTNALNSRVQSEISIKQLAADVVNTGEHSIYDRNSEAFDDISNLPSFGPYPDKYKTARYAIVSIQPALLVVNTNTAAKDVRSWQDLVDPRWKGRMATINPKGSIGIASFFSGLQKRYGDEFLEKLSAQELNIQTASAPTAQLVAAGEADIGFPISVSVLPALRKAGAPVAIVPVEFATGSELTSAVSAMAPNPEGARLLLNFMMSRQGQEMINGGELGCSPLSGVAGSAELPGYYVSPDETLAQSEIDRVARIVTGA